MKLTEQCVSFGDICTSKVWVSFERRYFALWRWHLSFGPTYNGTTGGFCLGLPFAVIIGHYRPRPLGKTWY